MEKQALHFASMMVDGLRTIIPDCVMDLACLGDEEDACIRGWWQRH